jgi:UDP-glucose 4-epimerase
VSLILVTGGAGFIGSHVVEALLARAYKVRVLDNLAQGDRSYLPESKDVAFIRGDVTDYATCRDVMRGVEGVFHLAAMSKVGPSLGDPDMIPFCTHQNVVGTENVLRAALGHKAHIRKFIYAASSTYYGTNPPPHDEDQKPSCQTPYALSKYVGELYCELFSRLHGMPTVRLRYFMAYGPRQPSAGPYAVVTGMFLKQWENNQPLTILGDGMQTRDFIHVQDVAEGSVVAFERAVTDATINLGTGKSLSIKNLATLISSAHVHLPRREHDIPHQQASLTRARQLLHWQPRRDLAQYLRSLIRRKVEEQPGKFHVPEWLREEGAGRERPWLPQVDRPGGGENKPPRQEPSDDAGE